ncbi:MAG TPA: WGxxGxxG family protein [Leptolyngbyaceae cyanobacterium]
MKSSKLSKFVGAGLLSLSLAVVPVAASATTGTGTDTTTTSPNTTNTTVDTDRRAGTDYARDDGFDWGWLGLLGLLGLAGLAGRKREEPARYREPDEVSRPGARF